MISAMAADVEKTIIINTKVMAAAMAFFQVKIFEKRFLYDGHLLDGGC